MCPVTKNELQRLLRKAELLSRETTNSAENKHGFFIYNSSCNLFRNLAPAKMIGLEMGQISDEMCVGHT